MILSVGITGGIGSGKTTVAKIFNTLGIPVFDADNVAKNIMNEDEDVKGNIAEIFGKKAYENGKLDRKFIADIVFNDAEKLEKLNAIVHPATIAAAKKWMQQQITSYAVKEAALLFESRATADVDYIIGVYAPQHLRIKRVIERDKLSQEEIIKRMSKQIDEEIKIRLCDFVIVNDEQQLTIPQVIKLHEKLLALATTKTANTD